MIGWKLNQFGLVNVTNIRVDLFLTYILVKYIGYLCLTNAIGYKDHQLGLVNLTSILVDMCLTKISVI